MIFSKRVKPDVPEKPDMPDSFNFQKKLFTFHFVESFHLISFLAIFALK